MHTPFDEWITDRSLCHGWHPQPLRGNYFFWTEPAPCLTLRASGRPLKFWFFAVRVHYEKNSSHAETLCFLISFWSIRPFKGHRRKTGPREAETDSSAEQRGDGRRSFVVAFCFKFELCNELIQGGRNRVKVGICMQVVNTSVLTERTRPSD